MSVKLTDSQNLMLRGACLRGDRCLTLPPALKGRAAQKVADKLIAEGLVKETKAKGEAPVWRRNGEGGEAFALKLTAAGVKASAPRAQHASGCDCGSCRRGRSASPTLSVDGLDRSGQPA
jgi:hypothetical protein